MAQPPIPHVLIIGMDQWESDAEAMSAAWQNNLGVPSRCIEVLRSPTKTAVQETLSAIGDSAEPEDVLVFYYSGHGNRSAEEFYMCTAGEDMSHKELNKWIAGTGIKTQLRIIDACHSGAYGEVKSVRAVNAMPFTALDIQVFLEGLGIVVMAACRPEDTTAGSSPFTENILKYLSAQSMGNVVTPMAMFDAVSISMKAEGKPAPSISTVASYETFSISTDPAAVNAALVTSIFIKGPESKTSTIALDRRGFREMNVADFKQRVQDKTGVPTDKQSLKYAAKELEDDRLLTDYGMGDHATVFLVTRVLGGRITNV